MRSREGSGSNYVVFILKIENLNLFMKKHLKRKAEFKVLQTKWLVVFKSEEFKRHKTKELFKTEGN